MSAIVTAVTRTTILSNTYDWLFTNTGLIVLMLLVMLLMEKELLRALGNARSRLWLQTLDTMIAPLVASFTWLPQATARACSRAWLSDGGGRHHHVLAVDRFYFSLVRTPR